MTTERDDNDSIAFRDELLAFRQKYGGQAATKLLKLVAGVANPWDVKPPLVETVREALVNPTAEQLAACAASDDGTAGDTSLRKYSTAGRAADHADDDANTETAEEKLAGMGVDHHQKRKSESSLKPAQQKAAFDAKRKATDDAFRKAKTT